MALSFLARGVAMLTVTLSLAVPYRAKAENTLRLDYAYYNPVSLVLKEKHWVEEALGPDTPVQWVQSAGSNKTLEFLRGRSLDFGSTAGSAALLGRANGTPVKAIYVYAQAEWTALVTRADSPVHGIADLRGRRGSSPLISAHRWRHHLPLSRSWNTTSLRPHVVTTSQ